MKYLIKYTIGLVLRLLVVILTYLFSWFVDGIIFLYFFNLKEFRQHRLGSPDWEPSKMWILYGDNGQDQLFKDKL